MGRGIPGYARIRTEVPGSEGILDRCAQLDVPVKDVRRTESGGLELTVPAWGWRVLRDEAEECAPVRVKSGGVAALGEKLRRRWLLLALPLVLWAVLWISGLFVWQVEVVPCDGVDEARVLSVLDELGIYPGACRLAFSADKAANSALLRLEGISYLALNVTGSRAVIVARPETPVPEIEDDGESREICARLPGTITKMLVLEGVPAAAVGDAVSAGQVLVSSTAGSVSSGVRPVRANARVWADTLRSASAAAPIENIAKNYTGETKKRVSLIICGKRADLFFDSGTPWEYYDKKVNCVTPRVLGVSLPVTVVTELYREYEPAYAEKDAASVLETLRDGMLAGLEDDIALRGEVKSAEFSHRESGGWTRAELTALCNEDIALPPGQDE